MSADPIATVWPTCKEFFGEARVVLLAGFLPGSALAV
jgi:hypothetical protein